MRRLRTALLSSLLVAGLGACARGAEGTSESLAPRSDGGTPPAMGPVAAQYDAALPLAPLPPAALHFVVDLSREAGFRPASGKTPLSVFVETFERFAGTPRGLTTSYGLSTFPARPSGEPVPCSSSGDCADDHVCSNEICDHLGDAFCSSYCAGASDADCATCGDPFDCAAARCAGTLTPCKSDHDCGGGTAGLCEPATAFCAPEQSTCGAAGWMPLPLATARPPAAIVGALAEALPGGSVDPVRAYAAALEDAVKFAAAHPDRLVSLVVVRSGASLPDDGRCGVSMAGLARVAFVEHGVRTYVLALTSTLETYGGTLRDLEYLAVSGGTATAHLATCNATRCAELDRALESIARAAATPAP
jgi:hypothetical protein